jgi:hypothetical protein
MSRRRSAEKAGKQPKQRDVFVARPFAGLPDETEWVALREIVPAATAPLRLRSSDVPVTLSTVLPLHWPAMVTRSGRRFLGLQVGARSGDVSRDLAVALEQVLDAEPGSSVVPTGLPGEGPRLQDLLADQPLDVTVHQGFDFWLEGEQTEDDADEMRESMERANATVVPTARVEGLTSAYWCRMKERSHLRWVLPEEEAPLLDALARLAVARALDLGEGTRFVGTFRAHGLLVPVWDLPLEMEAQEVQAPAAELRARLDEALAGPPLDEQQRRARSGLLNRQLTLR